MTAYACLIHQAAAANQCTIYMAQWVCRLTDNQDTNFLLWWVDHNNWELLPSMVQLLHTQLSEWTVDWFANQNNTKHLVFNSLCPLLESAGVDVFAQSWSLGVSLLVLPLQLVSWCLAQVVENAATVVLLVPVWTAHEWWPLLLLVSVQSIHLGRVVDCLMPGPLGLFELGWNPVWAYEAHLVCGRRASASCEQCVRAAHRAHHQCQNVRCTDVHVNNHEHELLFTNLQRSTPGRPLPHPIAVSC
jgi:hypothetical protein